MVKHPTKSPAEPTLIIDQGIPASDDAPIPRWLVVSYCFLPIFGIVFLYMFWQGSFGVFDRGAWQALEQAANTR